MEIPTTLTQTRVNINEGYAHPQTCDGDVPGPRPLLSTARVQPKRARGDARRTTVTQITCPEYPMGNTNLYLHQAISTGKKLTDMDPYEHQ
jgi:hypothetical protein